MTGRPYYARATCHGACRSCCFLFVRLSGVFVGCAQADALGRMRAKECLPGKACKLIYGPIVVSVGLLVDVLYLNDVDVVEAAARIGIVPAGEDFFVYEAAFVH